MKAIQWPWRKKKEAEVEVIETTEVNTDKKSTGLNLRNPEQKRGLDDIQDPLSEAMLATAQESTGADIEECPAIFLVCECGKQHFRHTGYIETIVPYVAQDGGKIANDSHPVKTCCSCRKSYVNIGPKVYNVTDKIDIKAWEKFEKEAHKATGPGGEC